MKIDETAERLTTCTPDPIKRMVYAYIDAYPEATISPMTAYVAALDRKIDPCDVDPGKIQDISKGMLAAVEAYEAVRPDLNPWRPIDEAPRDENVQILHNFVRIHKTLKITPAMAAGMTDRLWSMEDVVALIDAAAPKPGPRGSYQKRGAEISN